MEQWYMNLDGTMQMFWACAIAASLVFAVQMVLTFIGMDATDGADVDFDVSDGGTLDVGGPMSLFSFRSMINFLVGFGWAGVSLREVIPLTWLLIIVAFLVGCVFGYMYVFLRRMLNKLESNGAYRLEDCVGKEADVYLRIPAAGKGRGKVQVSVGGSVHEVDAVTDGDELKTGSRVIISSVEGHVVKVVQN